MKKALTYEEFIALAKKNYENGGDVVVNCWDKAVFDYYTKNLETITEAVALKMFRDYKEEEPERTGSEW